MESVLRDLYIEKRSSSIEISKKLNCSHSTVLQYLKKFNIDRRPQGSNIHPKRGLQYGRKIRKGQESDHIRELAIISKMQKLRRDGLSFREIAHIFNREKVATKPGCGVWHGRTIKGILDRLTN